MSTKEQQAFIEAIEGHLEGVAFFSVGASEQCPDCPEYDEGNFSWSACESCGSTLGGNRYAAHGIIDGDVYHFDVCVDCLMYHANGEVPETWEG